MAGMTLLVVTAFVLPRAFLNSALLYELHKNDATPLYALALQTGSHSPWIRWRVGRYALKTGDVQQAYLLLNDLPNIKQDNTLMLNDVIMTRQASRHFDEAVQLYESTPALSAITETRNLTVLSYIELKQYQKALQLQPANLAANLAMLKSAGFVDDAIYLNRLHHAQIGAIQPVSALDATQILGAIPEIVQREVWTCSTAYNVLSYFVWKHPLNKNIAASIENLPGVCSDHAKTDLLSDLKIRQKAATVQASTQPYAAKRDSAKNLLPSTILHQLSQSGGADSHTWRWGKFTQPQNPLAEYFGDQDVQESPSSLRIQGFWQDRRASNDPLPYGEFVSDKIRLEPNTVYELSVRYKTDANTGEAIPFLGMLEYVKKPHFIFAHDELPPTHGEWKTWTKTGRSYSEPIDVNVLLRLFGTGTVWFDDVVLRKVEP